MMPLTTRCKRRQLRRGSGKPLSICRERTAENDLYGRMPKRPGQKSCKKTQCPLVNRARRTTRMQFAQLSAKINELLLSSRVEFTGRSSQAMDQELMALLRRSSQFLQKLMWSRHWEQLSFRSKPPELLPKKAGQGVSNTIRDTWDMMRGKGEIKTSRWRSKRIKQGIFEVREFKM